VLGDLLLGTATGGGMVAHIIVHTKETSLLRVDEDSGELVGSGALPADMVRQLAEQDPRSIWRRMLTDPTTGAATELSRTRYRPRAAVDEFVRHRAHTCFFPGCQRPSHRTDLDHITPHTKGGPATPQNLAPACRHHQIKDGNHPRWKVKVLGAGSYLVTSPTGHTYRSDPPTLHPPQPPTLHPPPPPRPPPHPEEPPPF
jgi:hypothetical protein